ncbi:MAG TPA: hypothetical protein V6C65_21785 [Allocoleopsis sp.]
MSQSSCRMLVMNRGMNEVVWDEAVVVLMLGTVEFSDELVMVEELDEETFLDGVFGGDREVIVKVLGRSIG